MPASSKAKISMLARSCFPHTHYNLMTNCIVKVNARSKMGVKVVTFNESYKIHPTSKLIGMLTFGKGACNLFSLVP